MSRKHFIELARILKQANQQAKREGSDPAIIERIQNEVASLCRKENSAFDFNKFAAACQA